MDSSRSASSSVDTDVSGSETGFSDFPGASEDTVFSVSSGFFADTDGNGHVTADESADYDYYYNQLLNTNNLSENAKTGLSVSGPIRIGLKTGATVNNYGFKVMFTINGKLLHTKTSTHYILRYCRPLSCHYCSCIEHSTRSILWLHCYQFR